MSPVHKYKGNNQVFHVLFFFFILIFAFCILNLDVSAVNAQSLSLSISPPILEVLIKPGKSITQVYKLFNTGETTIVTARIMELTENGLLEDKNFQAENWINTVSPNFSFGRPFLLLPNVEKQFVLRINPPVGTSEQDFYRVIVFSTMPNPPSEFSQSAAAISIGSILLIHTTSTGQLVKGARIGKFELPQIVDSFGPLTSNITVENTGKTYFRPIGAITLTGPVGKGSFKLVPNVLFAGQTKQLFAENTFDNKTLNLPGFFLGKYQLGVNFTVGEGTLKIEQTKTFYAIPWKAGMGVLGIVFLLFIIRKKKKK